jgi:predicted dehydrogenase
VVDLKNAAPGVAPGERSNDTENTSSPVVSDFMGHKVIVEDFIRAIAENGTPMCDGAEGVRSVALVEKIYAAASANRGN